MKPIVLNASLIILVLLIGGCNKSERNAVVSEWKTDKGPIEKRFKNIQTMKSVSWKGGLLDQNNDRLAPPPLNEYYLKGFILVPANEKWKQQYAWEAVKKSQKIPKDFPAGIPTNVHFQWSSEFEKEYLPEHWYGTILCSPEQGVIYFDIFTT